MADFAVLIYGEHEENSDRTIQKMLTEFEADMARAGFRTHDHFVTLEAKLTDNPRPEDVKLPDPPPPPSPLISRDDVREIVRAEFKPLVLELRPWWLRLLHWLRGTR